MMRSKEKQSEHVREPSYARTSRPAQSRKQTVVGVGRSLPNSAVSRARFPRRNCTWRTWRFALRCPSPVQRFFFFGEGSQEQGCGAKIGTSRPFTAVFHLGRWASCQVLEYVEVTWRSSERSDGLHQSSCRTQGVNNCEHPLVVLVFVCLWHFSCVSCSC